MDSHIILNTSLVEIKAEHGSSEEVIRHLFEKLYSFRYVKESYLEAVLDREKVYPTGLPLAKMCVAIPHTDSEHVLKPSVAISILDKPITFSMMGSPNTKIEVEIVLMLAISNPQNQILMLQRLMDVFQNEQLMEAIKNAKQEEEVVNLLINQLKLNESA